ncbi:MAG: fibronectin type III domain-containing protein [Acidobacteriia bacterium]|nr:fibronectin type III domain-containing protein [Terriglobia bacterium]
MKNDSRRPTIIRHGGFLFAALVCFLGGCGGSRRDAQIEAHAKPHSVTVVWTPGPAPSVAGYNVFRDSIPGPVAVKLNPKPLIETQFQDMTVEAGRTYSYYVIAVDARGHESGPSQRAVAQVPPPETPSFLSRLFHLFRSGS